MRRFMRIVPWLVVGTALLHLAIGLVKPNPLAAIVHEGVFNTQTGAARGEWVLYMLFGGLLLGFGELIRWTLRTTGRIPRRAGVFLLCIAGVAVALQPASGAWLAFAIGLVIVMLPAPEHGKSVTPVQAAVG